MKGKRFPFVSLFKKEAAIFFPMKKRLLVAILRMADYYFHISKRGSFAVTNSRTEDISFMEKKEKPWI